ncbi:hypothetical protein [Parasedimentitalea denitrificans]|nr:hypothetical protein [Sedimentitalea sp. CY04]
MTVDKLFHGPFQRGMEQADKADLAPVDIISDSPYTRVIRHLGVSS